MSSKSIAQMETEITICVS